MPEQLERLIERVGGRQRAAILAGGIASLLLILGVSWWATAPNWVPVYQNLPLESVGEMTKGLDDAKIEYRLVDQGTTIEVASDDLARARVTLAEGGKLPDKGRPGLEIFDQPSWGMTDFAQRMNYRRALEGELERTIGKMRGIESADVALALSETASFRRAQSGPAEASVVLRLDNGQSPDADVVRGIQQLVSGSVGDLQSDNVKVLDDSGRLLSVPNEPGSLSALTSRQLELQREVEDRLKQKAQTLLDQVLGAGNAQIEVSAEINFDRVERTSDILDPDYQVAQSEQTSEIVPGADGGAGSRTEQTTYQNSRRLETFSGAVGGVRRLTVAVVVKNRETAGPNGSTNVVPRTARELTEIQALVEKTVGYSAGRGDQISVVAMQFPDKQPVPEDRPGVVEVAWQYRNLGVTLLALIMAFFVALKFVRALRPKEQEAEEDVDALAPLTVSALPAGAIRAEEDEVESVKPQVARLPSQRERITGVIEENPDAVVSLIRTWLEEDA